MGMGKSAADALPGEDFALTFLFFPLAQVLNVAQGSCNARLNVDVCSVALNLSFDPDAFLHSQLPAELRRRGVVCTYVKDGHHLFR